MSPVMRWAGILSIRKSTTRILVVMKRTPPPRYTDCLSVVLMSVVTLLGS